MTGQMIPLAIGRILRLASRPEQPGDAAEYERCRALILDASDPVQLSRVTAPAPGWNFGAGRDGVVE